MAEESKVTLYGFWASPYVRRVELALKIKGIPFEYVEEDVMKNKSRQLLNYNPVYKKVPVLLHNGNPISESLVIVEYIDETWKNSTPSFLPQDPYKRAKVRFWASYIEQHVVGAMLMVAKSQGEAQEKVIKEAWEKLQVLEQGMEELFLDGNTAVSDIRHVGYLDIIIMSMFVSNEAREEVFGIKFLDSEKTPLLFSRVQAIKELPLVKEVIPPHEKLVAFFNSFKENARRSS